ncbi:hypothetical protein KGF54_000360 [Candida jiufengensis]|uniref:uncharacterized protein n=1 Tax=Candida jiufengensis TaxID=497108 RepID=UPI002224DE62|nr:uncharacterized protein KGF54_000360 [Candida jiufengensis]KAI5956743.1 hypothetical protein KGF54_000360 [Candida jiufengensis]
MQYSKIALLSTISGALASYNSTVVDISSITLTVTSCHLDACKTSEVITGVTTVTEVDTTYTTYCPLTSGPAPTTVAAESSAAPSTHANATVSSYSAGAGKVQVGAALLAGAALLL